jgi:uncharacterized protein (TIGR00251 family)
VIDRVALRDDGDAVVVPIAARPNAGRSSVQGVHGDALKVALGAPPEKGKANRELLGFLAKVLGVRRTQLELISGQTSRAKAVRVSGVALSAVRSKLAARLSG